MALTSSIRSRQLFAEWLQLKPQQRAIHSPFALGLPLFNHSLGSHNGASDSRCIKAETPGPRIKYVQADKKLLGHAHLSISINTTFTYSISIYFFQPSLSLSIVHCIHFITVSCHFLPWHRRRRGRETRSQMLNHRRCSSRITAQLGCSRTHLLLCLFWHNTDDIATPLDLMSRRLKSSVNTNLSRSIRASSNSTLSISKRA